jgi:AraC-like DNA-binding protein
MYARIVRFEAALHRKAASPITHWTDIAHALGYHDQMHMVHDFNRLSGDTPTAICRQLDMFVRPELISADRPPRNQWVVVPASYRGAGNREKDSRVRRSGNARSLP